MEGQNDYWQIIAKMETHLANPKYTHLFSVPLPNIKYTVYII